MKTIEEIGMGIGFQTKSKNYRKAFYDKYIRTINYHIVIEHYDLIHIFNLSDKLNWSYISIYQKLSESFMREFKDKLNWSNISIYQILSESFMREFKNKVDWDWDYVSMYQKLSETFMREFKDQVDWDYISVYQVLSESFIEEFKHKLNRYFISKYQYKNDKQFVHSLDDLSLYEIIDGYVYGYKAVRSDRYSLFNFQYQYEDNSIHESFSDQTSDENSFGLSIGTKEFANEYGSGKQYILLYVRTKISDITRIVHKGQKLRSRRIEIINEVEK